jgi:hypothetical protein
MQVLDLQLPYRYLRKLIYPVEAYRFWEYYCPGFREPFRDLVKNDVRPAVKSALRSALRQTMTGRRNRLLLKLTGWPRISFLKEILPEARFIHIYRDGRAVANSLVATRWWSGWRGPANWRWGELTPQQMEKWRQHDRSFLALAAIEWEILMGAQKEAAQRTDPEDLLWLRYEDLCEDPMRVIRLALEFAQLDPSPKFEERVRQTSFKNRNEKWRRALTSEQQAVLDKCLHQSLRKYGYA